MAVSNVAFARSKYQAPDLLQFMAAHSQKPCLYSVRRSLPKVLPHALVMPVARNSPDILGTLYRALTPKVVGFGYSTRLRAVGLQSLDVPEDQNGSEGLHHQRVVSWLMKSYQIEEKMFLTLIAQSHSKFRTPPLRRPNQRQFSR